MIETLINILLQRRKGNELDTTQPTKTLQSTKQSSFPHTIKS